MSLQYPRNVLRRNFRNILRICRYWILGMSCGGFSEYSEDLPLQYLSNIPIQGMSWGGISEIFWASVGTVYYGDVLWRIFRVFCGFVVTISLGFPSEYLRSRSCPIIVIFFVKMLFDQTLKWIRYKANLIYMQISALFINAWESSSHEKTKSAESFKILLK